MLTPLPVPDWRKSLVAALVSTAAIITAFVLLASAPHTHAQGQIKLEISKQLEGSNLIRVGEEMTFTIRIRNTGTVSVTKLPLLDRYNASVLQLRRSTPPFSSHDSASGLITWTDITTTTQFGPLAPGQEIRITTVFRAIRAAPETVNFAEIGAAQGTGGETGGGEKDQDSGGAEGGRVITTKGLAPGQTPIIGRPITFTITLRNEGAADLVKLPLEDVFNPEYLAFASAKPAPSGITPNRLNWDDVLPLLGRTRLRPNEVITVTTVFTALKVFDGAGINNAAASGVEDEFGNQVAAPRQAEIPVRIIADAGSAPTATPTTVSTSRPRPTDTPAETPAPTAETGATPGATTTPAMPVATAEQGALPTVGAAPTPTATSTQPTALPRTGASVSNRWWVLGLLMLVVGLCLHTGLLHHWRRP